MIGGYLQEIRRRLIRSHKNGFAPNPANIPTALYVHKLAELRDDPFLEFRGGLVEDRVLVVKVITSCEVPLL